MKNLLIGFIKIHYKKFSGLSYLINKLKVSKIFWKYRHLVDSNVWEDYLNDYSTKRRDFYSDFVRSKSLNLIFEFGCASGPNLKNIEKNIDYPIFLVGYDLNPKAIQKAKKVFNSKNSFFLSKINPSIIKNILVSRNKLYFDLVIFDRVFFLFKEAIIKKHIHEYSKYYKFVIIDDFHNDIKIESFENYNTKNFINLFNEFELISIGDSEHKINSEFFKLYAKRIVLKNKNF